MKPASLWSVLLALAVVSAVARPMGAAPPPTKEPPPPTKQPSPMKEPGPLPLKELTQEKVRDWAAAAVAADRKNPDKAEFWMELDQLIEIAPEKIVYEHDKGVPVKLMWECTPRRSLDVEERLKAAKGLAKVYNFALFEHDKGLVAESDAEVLTGVAHLEIGPNPTPTPPPTKEPSPPAKEPAPPTKEPSPPTKEPPPPTKEPIPPPTKEPTNPPMKEPPPPTKEPTNPGPRKHPQKVEAGPLKELTQEKVQDWTAVAIDALRADPAWADFWKEMDPLIVIDPDQIVYEQEKGIPMKLDWECTPRRGLTADERLKARDGLRKLAQHVFYEHNKGLVAGPDVDLITGVTHLEIGPNPTPTPPPMKEPSPPKVAGNDEECERVRRELEEQRKLVTELKATVERLKAEAAARSAPPAPTPVAPSATLPAPRFNPVNPVNPVNPAPEGRRYVLMLQPSSMIYYDCCSHCWLPGPSSLVYVPVGAGDTAQSERRGAFAAAPASTLPAPREVSERRPTQTAPVPEPSADADRLFWVGYRSYWQGDYDRALASFGAAVRIDGQDARFWYYRALAERALGDAVQAEASAQHGRELHAAHRPRAELVSAAIERVQGAERRFLNAPEVVVSDAKNDR